MGPVNRHCRALPIGARPSVGAIVSYLGAASPGRDAIALFHVVTDWRDRLPIRLSGVRVSLGEPATTAEPIPQTYKGTPVIGAAGFRVRDIHDIPSTEARTAFARARNRAARCRGEWIAGFVPQADIGGKPGLDWRLGQICPTVGVWMVVAAAQPGRGDLGKHAGTTVEPDLYGGMTHGGPLYYLYVG